jgi:hypothetical protein
MPFFSKVFRRDGAAKGKNQTVNAPEAPIRPKWEESWSRKEVAAEEVQELIHACSHEMKSRGMPSAFAALTCKDELLTEGDSVGYALPPATFPTRLRSRRLKELHPQLFPTTIRG